MDLTFFTIIGKTRGDRYWNRVILRQRDGTPIVLSSSYARRMIHFDTQGEAEAYIPTLPTEYEYRVEDYSTAMDRLRPKERE